MKRELRPCVVEFFTGPSSEFPLPPAGEGGPKDRERGGPESEPAVPSGPLSPATRGLSPASGREERPGGLDQGMRSAFLIGAVMLCASGSAHAQTPEARLRDQLRQSVTELRQVQDENAALKSELDNLRRNGPAPVAAPTPAPKAEAPAVDAAELRQARARASNEAARARQLEEQLAATQKVLVQWQDSQKQAAQLARTRDTAAREFETQLAQTRETVTACEAKNATLVSIADELVGRYRNKGALASVSDREPLLGLSRKYELIAQEYRGRIIDASVQLPSVEETQQKPQ
jgi:hypothetical protein